MTALHIYGLKKCSTCQKALQWFADKNIAVEFHDHQELPPDRDKIAAWAKALGGWEKMINRAGYTWRGLSESDRDNLDDSKAVTLAAQHTSLIRRPLIEFPDGTVTVGFSEKVKALF
jgi:arsenate reductase (glutaredoxin)